MIMVVVLDMEKYINFLTSGTIAILSWANGVSQCGVKDPDIPALTRPFEINDINYLFNYKK